MRLLSAWRYISSVTDLDIDELKKEGLKLIIMDFDNTLAFHGSETISSAILDFIDSLRKNGFYVYILSNAKSKRMMPVLKKSGLDGRGGSRKPFIGVLSKAIKSSGYTNQETVLVGDQIFTDIMAGNIAGIKTVLVEKAGRSETFFIKLKRVAERMVSKRRKGID